MWNIMLIFKALSRAPGTQFYLGDETGALASPHLGREQLPCTGKGVVVAKPLQARAKPDVSTAAGTTTSPRPRQEERSAKPSGTQDTTQDKRMPKRIPEAMATGWRKTVVPPWQDTQTWHGRSKWSGALPAINVWCASWSLLFVVP